MDKNITNAERAAALGITPMTLYRWEKAGKDLSTSRSVRGKPGRGAYPWVCDACGTTLKAPPDMQPACTCGSLMQPVISKFRARRKSPQYFPGSTTWDKLANDLITSTRQRIDRVRP